MSKRLTLRSLVKSVQTARLHDLAARKAGEPFDADRSEFQSLRGGSLLAVCPHDTRYAEASTLRVKRVYGVRELSNAGVKLFVGEMIPVSSPNEARPCFGRIDPSGLCHIVEEPLDIKRMQSWS